MSRRTPVILDQTYVGNLVHTITDSDPVFAVFREGQPINYHQMSRLGAPPQYRRTTFVTEGTAKLLARKLNALFETDAYQVVRMTPDEDA